MRILPMGRKLLDLGRKFSDPRLMIRLIVVLVLALACLPCWANDSISPALFESDNAFRSDRDAAERIDAMIMRHRFVVVRTDRLLQGSQPTKNIQLPFFKNASFQAVNTKFERLSQSSFTWIGHIAKARFSLVVLVVEGKTFEGHANVNGHIYQIRSVADGLHVVREINQKFWRKHNDVPDSPARERSISRDSLSNQTAASLSTIDIMIVYTAARANGSISSEIQSAISTANQIFSDSQVNAQLRLVYSGQTSIIESGSVDTDLQRLSNNSQIAALRDQYGADLVSMWVKDANGCGKANQVGPFSVVVEQGCITPYDFTHEVGHCLGGNHDKYVNPGSNPFPYSHGLVHLEYIDPVCNGGWYTIMAYPDECQDKGVLCCQISYFSNPNINHNGDSTGIPDEADNHRALNNEAPIVAGWKQPPSCNQSGVPSLVSPANGSTGVSSATTLDWSAAANATSYKIEVAADSSFNNIVRSQSTTGTSWAVTPALADGMSYWWRVHGENICSRSAFSPAWTFQTKSPGCILPSTPSPISPSNGSTGISTSATLKWASSSGATSYNVQVATDSAFSNVIRSANVSGTSWAISPALTPGKYYWRVRGSNSCGKSTYSSTWNFTTTCGTTSQLLKNPDFETGNVRWSVNASSIINNGAKYPAKRGSWKAQLNGKGKTSTNWLYQQITIPANACSATLSFYLRVVTAETTTTRSNDKLKVQVLNGSGNLLKTLRTYSNLNKSSSYVKKSFGLSAYKGQTIRIRFYGTENASKQTTFLIDDTGVAVKK